MPVEVPTLTSPPISPTNVWKMLSRGVAEVLAPALHDPVGGDDHTAATLAALMHDGLQQLGAGVRDAAGQEEIIEHE